MGDRQGRPSAVTLRPFVGVDFKLWPTVADTLVSRVLREPVVYATEPRKNQITYLVFSRLQNCEQQLKFKINSAVIRNVRNRKLFHRFYSDHGFLTAFN